MAALRRRLVCNEGSVPIKTEHIARRRMAVDYAPDAVLSRPDRSYTGLDEIVAYFASVPVRLAGGRGLLTRIAALLSGVCA